jgi:hypothetical protein
LGTYNAVISGVSSIYAIPKAMYNLGWQGLKQVPFFERQTRSEIYAKYEPDIYELKFERDTISSPLMKIQYAGWINKLEKIKKEQYKLNDYIPIFKDNVKSLSLNIAMKGLFTSAYRDTLVSMLSFGAITIKLILDLIDENIKDFSLWETYGVTETYFKETDIEELVKEIENIESERLQSIGYRPIDINNPVFEPIQTIEEPPVIPMEEDTNPMEDELDEITEEEYYLLTQT